MKIEKAKQVHRTQILELAKLEYETEAKHCSELPQIDFIEATTNLIRDLIDAKYTFVALEQEKVIGFLGFWAPIDEFFGHASGAYSPLSGSAFTGPNRNQVCSRLLAEAMQTMQQDGITSFAMTRFAHDDEIARGLVLNGYGIRCSDAIRDLKRNCEDLKLLNTDPMISYEELPKEEFMSIVGLRRELAAHLLNCPICMVTPEEYFTHLEERQKNRIFVAKNQKDIIGFIEVQYGDGENYITQDKSMLNICGTCVTKEYRGKMVAQTILNHLIQTAVKEGITYLGVDCETINPTALRFWSKYFQNYTYSYTRRIDERVLEESRGESK